MSSSSACHYGVYLPRHPNRTIAPPAKCIEGPSIASVNVVAYQRTAAGRLLSCETRRQSSAIKCVRIPTELYNSRAIPNHTAGSDALQRCINRRSDSRPTTTKWQCTGSLVSPTSGDAADAVTAEGSPYIKDDHNGSRDVSGSIATDTANGTLEPSLSLEAATTDSPVVVVEVVESSAVSKGGSRPWVAFWLPFWSQAKDILLFAGPALGIWLSHPLMSLIDTAVVGQGSSIELAALGPGTAVSDNLSFLFMFLSVATANLVATSLAKQDMEEASHHFARLLFVALVAGVAMALISQLAIPHLVAAFSTANADIIPAASTYAKIRGLAWPAVLLTSVAQSASLGMQDAWQPLICVAVASLVNLCGDIIFCSFMGLGIAGAAAATALSQYVACFLMLRAIHLSHRLRLRIAAPSLLELRDFLSLAAPIFLTLLAKTGFYTSLVFYATTLGMMPLAAHQVAGGVFAVCAVCAEPLSQTAQAFLPALLTGAHKSDGFSKARSLFRSLALLSLLLGASEAAAAALAVRFGASLFTSDAAVIAQVQRVVAPLSVSLTLNPLVLAAEGTLLAQQDMAYLAFALPCCLAFCCSLLTAATMAGVGNFLSMWWVVVAFQIARLSFTLTRISSSLELKQWYAF